MLFITYKNSQYKTYYINNKKTFTRGVKEKLAYKVRLLLDRKTAMLWNYLRSLSLAAIADVILQSCLVFTTITINQLTIKIFQPMTQTPRIEYPIVSR